MYATQILYLNLYQLIRNVEAILWASFFQILLVQYFHSSTKFFEVKFFIQ